jgi:DNA recombination protein RmuC
LEAIRSTFESKLLLFQQNLDGNHKESRQALKENLDGFKKELNEALNDYKDRLKDLFSGFEKNQFTQNTSNNEKITELRSALESSVKSMQENNEKKLEEMRKTVDEKLNETLEKRLGESFKQVSDRLEAVHKGLGEMQTLAISVGDLKKVMSNVKSRGILGEYQLQNIIEDLLTNEQYEKNVKTKVGSGALVEFAIKMPHGNNFDKTLWLPVDSKFPKEDYEALLDAYDNADVEKIDLCRKAFIRGIRKNAQDIKEKYIDPPNTTEYGIMFLPFESLFGEVLRVPGLFEQLQKDYKITITGPTTLSALLNSLQMGFRTLAIEKRSGEVWDLLGAVKTEFGQFGTILEKTKKKLDEATNVIESAGVRSRAIEKKLRNVQELPSGRTPPLLDSYDNEEDPV